MHDAMIVGDMMVLIIPCSDKPLPRRKHGYRVGFMLGLSERWESDDLGFCAFCCRRSSLTGVNGSNTAKLQAWPLGRPHSKKW